MARSGAAGKVAVTWSACQRPGPWRGGPARVGPGRGACVGCARRRRPDAPARAGHEPLFARRCRRPSGCHPRRGAAAGRAAGSNTASASERRARAGSGGDRWGRGSSERAAYRTSCRGPLTTAGACSLSRALRSGRDAGEPLGKRMVRGIGSGRGFPTVVFAAGKLLCERLEEHPCLANRIRGRHRPFAFSDHHPLRPASG